MRNILISGILLYLLSTCSFAKAKNVSFTYYNVENGLSQNSVTAIEQDTLGRIWIGTRDGVNIYDGSKFSYLRSVRGDSTSILGHFVTKIVPFSPNHFGIITKSGLSIIDVKSYKCKRYPKDNLIAAMYFNGEVLLGTKEGLFRLDTVNGKLVRKPEIPIHQTSVRNIYQDRLGKLWICTSNGLFVFNPESKSLKRVIDLYTNAVLIDSQKRIWVGTEGYGVFLLDSQHRVIRHFSDKLGDENLINNHIRAIVEDNFGDIWVGTFLGLSVINTDSYEVTNYAHDKEEKNTLSHNSIYSILKDKQGGLWLGTYFGGISYYHYDFSLFKKYPNLVDDGYGVSFNIIGRLCEDHDKNLWIATEGGGVTHYNRKDQTYKHYIHHEGKPGLSHNNVKALVWQDRHTLLIGTHNGGLNILDVPSGKIQVYQHNPKDSTSIQSDVVDDIIPYKDYFLLATKKGVIKYDPYDQSFSPLIINDKYNLSEKAVDCLFEDSFGVLWIATEEQGLFNYNSETGKIRKFESSDTDFTTISSNNITCIFEDNQFRLWFGSHGDGLNLYLKEKDEFVNYTMEKNNLPNDFILGIAESRDGNMWISTARGLARFDTETKTSYNYSKENGLSIPELNLRSLYITHDGEVIVGGLGGMLSFQEKDILNRPNGFNLVFSELIVNNKRVAPGDETGILEKRLPFENAITLSAKQNAFTINYSACNYILTNQNTYEYKLENYDDDWVKAGNNTSVTYTNLYPGKYVLKVKALSSVEDRVVVDRELAIKIEKPLHKEWYAYLSYALLLTLVIWWLNHLYQARVKLANKVKAEQQEKASIQQLNQSKLNFFTSISHEFRTPLTLLTGMLQSVLEDSRTRPENYKKLHITFNNVIRLNKLITELLDFRRLEHGILQLRVTENKISPFVDEIFQSFVAYSEQNEIEYELKQSSKNLSLWFDKAQLEKVIYNLLSNAFKFVENKTGKILLEVKEEDAEIEILVKDNGRGIPSSELDKVFDPYYQVDHLDQQDKAGSGIGLALSKNIVNEHQGSITVQSEERVETVFSIKLKKGNRHFTEEQIETTNAALVEDFTPTNITTDEGTPVFESLPAPENAPVVLIVEDNLDVQNLLKGILSDQFQILIANNGLEGLNMAISQQPDLIVSDIMMPEMSGTRMCAKLKRNVETCHIPIILLSARASVEYRIEGLETGADDYITKPFDTRILKTKVKTMLQNRTLLQSKFKHDPSVKVTEVASNSIDQKLLEQAKEIIERNLDNSDFDIQAFASEMRLGRTRLFAKIKGITGQTPKDFILSTRLKRAAEMLLDDNSEANVSEITYAVGFTTPRYFSRCFREHFGVPPSKYGKSSASDVDDEGDSSENDV